MRTKKIKVVEKHHHRKLSARSSKSTNPAGETVIIDHCRCGASRETIVHPLFDEVSQWTGGNPSYVPNPFAVALGKLKSGKPQSAKAMAARQANAEKGGKKPGPAVEELMATLPHGYEEGRPVSRLVYKRTTPGKYINWLERFVIDGHVFGEEVSRLKPSLEIKEGMSHDH